MIRNFGTWSVLENLKGFSKGGVRESPFAEFFDMFMRQGICCFYFLRVISSHSLFGKQILILKTFMVQRKLFALRNRTIFFGEFCFLSSFKELKRCKGHVFWRDLNSFFFCWINYQIISSTQIFFNSNLFTKNSSVKSLFGWERKDFLSIFSYRAKTIFFFQRFFNFIESTKVAIFPIQ